MILKKGFFLVELMIALSILFIFILFFLHFSYVTLQTRKLSLNRLKMINELILTTETRKAENKFSLNIKQKIHTIKISKDSFFSFRLCECATNMNENHSTGKNAKLLFVVPC